MRMSFVVFAVLVTVFLFGCKDQNNSKIYANPLINDNVVSYLKKQMNMDSPDDNPIAQCGSYYAGYLGTEKFKNYCDQWSVKEFEKLHQNLNITYKASIENFRDSALWQIVIPSEHPAPS